MVLTVSFVLSPAIGLVCHRHLRFPADLTPASRRQDHTTLPSASAQFVKRAARVHRIPPRVRDDRERPSGGGTAGDIELIWVKLEREYFCNQDWTAQISLIPLLNLVFS